MKTINTDTVPSVNPVEQTERKSKWRTYLTLGLGVAALGTGVVLADPEAAQAFGERLLDAVTPEFKPLFDNEYVGTPSDSGSNFLPIIDHPVVTPQDGGPVMS